MEALTRGNDVFIYERRLLSFGKRIFLIEQRTATPQKKGTAVTIINTIDNL